MAVGQAVLTSTLDVGALNAAETRLEVRGVAVCHAHGQLLREVLELHRVLSAAGAQLSTVPQAALLLQVSESAAHALLAEAELLASLPGGLEALDCGLLTVAQSAALLRAVGGLGPEVQSSVWAQLQARLVGAAQEGVVLPPARLSSLLARWVVQADPGAAHDRRRAAEAQGDVSYRRREDGLGDLLATGVPAPLLQAVLCRIRAAAQPFGSQDDRAPGKRRLDAMLDLLLGRQQLPLPDEPSSCGCSLGSPAPCGAEVLVHVPVGAALGTTDELAELVGHGPLHPDQLVALLTSSPRLRVVRVDADGVPVSVDARAPAAPRGDLEAVRLLIRAMASGPPGFAHPRHPFDHGDGLHEDQASAPLPDRDRPRVRADGHPPDTAGSYRLPRTLRRLVQARAPRCEWPGCGVRSQACDVDHDRPWPAGATCACNTGPLCRRHHRVKQLLMTKVRGAGSAVTWTGPTGRSWTSPGQHAAPSPAVRPQPLALVQEHDLSPAALAELLAQPDTDPAQYELRADEDDARDVDALGERLRRDDGWGLALDDPYRWTA